MNLKSNVWDYLLCDLKVANSVSWVEQADVTSLGVSSRKIRSGLATAFFRFSWTSLSRKVIRCSVFLRCLYQPIKLS